MFQDEKTSLALSASRRKRRRIDFSSSYQALTLGLRVHGHTLPQGFNKYCATRCQNCTVNGPRQNVWRGRCTGFSCLLFSVDVCVKTFPGLRLRFEQCNALKRSFRCAGLHALQDLLGETLIGLIAPILEQQLRVLLFNTVLRDITQTKKETLRTRVCL